METSGRGEVNWYQDVTWPAHYADLRTSGGIGCLGSAERVGVWLPLGLRSTTWNDEGGPAPEISEIAAYDLATERLRALAPAALHELAEVGQQALEQTK